MKTNRKSTAPARKRRAPRVPAVTFSQFADDVRERLTAGGVNVAAARLNNAIALGVYGLLYSEVLADERDGVLEPLDYAEEVECIGAVSYLNREMDNVEILRAACEVERQWDFRTQNAKTANHASVFEKFANDVQQVLISRTPKRRAAATMVNTVLSAAYYDRPYSAVALGPLVMPAPYWEKAMARYTDADRSVAQMLEASIGDVYDAWLSKLPHRAIPAVTVEAMQRCAVLHRRAVVGVDTGTFKPRDRPKKERTRKALEKEIRFRIPEAGWCDASYDAADVDMLDWIFHKLRASVGEPSASAAVCRFYAGTTAIQAQLREENPMELLTPVFGDAIFDYGTIPDDLSKLSPGERALLIEGAATAPLRARSRGTGLLRRKPPPPAFDIHELVAAGAEFVNRKPLRGRKRPV